MARGEAMRRGHPIYRAHKQAGIAMAQPESTPESVPTYQCEVIPGRETRTVRFFCPHCRRWHSHGWPYDAEGDVGHRVEHCITEAGKAAHPRGYVLVARPVGGANGGS